MSARSGPTWLQNPMAKTRLAQFGSLLMEQGMLPARDKYLCRLHPLAGRGACCRRGRRTAPLHRGGCSAYSPKLSEEECRLRRKRPSCSGFDVTGQLGHPKGPSYADLV